MEEALEKIKGKTVVFNDLYVSNGYIYQLVPSDYRYFMPAKEFLEMLFDNMHNNIAIDVKNIAVHIIDYQYLTDGLQHIIMNKYNVCRGYFPQFKGQSLEPILGTNLYAYLKDECKRQKLRGDAKFLKTNMIEFMKTQKSFDDVSEFERILNAIE